MSAIPRMSYSRKMAGLSIPLILAVPRHRRWESRQQPLLVDRLNLYRRPPRTLQPALKTMQSRIFVPHSRDIYVIPGVLEPTEHGDVIRIDVLLKFLPRNLYILDVLPDHAAEGLRQQRHRQFIAGDLKRATLPVFRMFERLRDYTANVVDGQHLQARLRGQR